MFHLTTGPFRTIEKTLIDDLLAVRASDPLAPLLILSPSAHMLTRLQSELSRRGKGFLNIHSLTFYALAERLLVDSNYTEPVVVEPAFYTELIQTILSGDQPEPVDVEIRNALRIEGQTIPRGLAGALAATVKDLRDSGVRADHALKAAQQGFLGTEAPEAASTLALHARLIGLFEKHNVRSSADLLRRAAQRAPAHPWIKQQKAVFLYGFYDLTGVQLDLMNSLAEHPNARIYFPYEVGNPAYAFAEKLLKDSAFVSKLMPSSPAATGRGSIVSPPVTAGNDVRTEVWSCSGPRDEVWLAAKEILRLTDEGVPFRDIAVVSRNPATYLSALREIFTANQIPYECSHNEPAGSHPLIKTIRTLLASPPAVSGRGPMDPPPETVGDDTWSAHVNWAKTFIESSFKMPPDPTDEETGLLKMVLESLDALMILDTLGRPVSREHFLTTWQDKADHLERPGLSTSHEGVKVLEVQEARGLPFRMVFVLGMNEKVFPRLIREDPFLSDAARSALAQATGARLSRKMDGYEEERMLFELTRQAASERLVLLTQRSDSEGKALIPSVYLKDIERETHAKPQRLARSMVEKFEHRTPLLWTPRELSFLINRAQLDPKAFYQALGWDAASFYQSLAAHRAVETFKGGVGPYDGQIEDPNALKAALSRSFSPTSLEDLAQCPFQYYAGHVLRIKPEEDLGKEGEMTHKALGKLFHRTLELFYTSYFTSSLPAGRQAPLASDGAPKDIAVVLNAAIEACFNEHAEALSTVYPLVVISSKSIIKKELLAFIKSDLEESKASGYRPTWFEQPLEGTLPLSSLTHRFYGKPDRLDVRDRDVRVVDYKSGKPKPWTGRIETSLIQGRFLQLPIYLGLAAQFASKTLGKPVTATDAALRPVRETDEEATEKTLTAAFWTSPSAAIFAENINELIKLIEKGSFYIEPDTGDWGYCARCDFALICRKEHMPSRLRAERDASRQRVHEKMHRIAPKDETSKKSKEKAVVS